MGYHTEGDGCGRIKLYDSVDLLHLYLGENDPSDDDRWCQPRTVTYLAPAERVAYMLTVKDGLLYDAFDNLFDTSDASTIHSGESRAIFVMMQDGTIYASKRHLARMFHHSSLSAGGPVASAGEMVVVQGRLELISNASGHYRPSPAINRQAVTELRNRGVDFTEVRVEEIESLSQTDIDKPTRAAFGAARAALYGVQFKSGSLSSYVPQALHAIVAADQAANEPLENTAADLRRALAFPGSLQEQIGFIDRPDGEIREFLNALATRLEAMASGASVEPVVGDGAQVAPVGQEETS